MASEIAFYHLLSTPLERALPKLLERVVERGMRAVIRAGSKERIEALDSLLWTYDPGSFLPHGAGDAFADAQPIYLTTEPVAPNSAQVLILVDGVDADDLEAFERVLDLFDGSDPQAVAAARDRWRARKEAGHTLTYWKQRDNGGWERAA